MRKYDELRSTTSNKVHRRLRINETNCGWCGLGAGCNKRNRQKYYHLSYKDGVVHNSKFPSWKLISKYRKQYQKPKISYDLYKSRNPREGYEIYDITWQLLTPY